MPPGLRVRPLPALFSRPLQRARPQRILHRPWVAFQARPKETPRRPSDCLYPRRAFSTGHALLRNYYPKDPRIWKDAIPTTATKGPGRRVPRGLTMGSVAALAVAAAVVFYWYNTQVVPVSGRKQFNAFSDAQVRKIVHAQYQRVIQDLEKQGKHFLPDWDWRTRMVKAVMKRLIPVSGMEDEEWEVRVIDDPGTCEVPENHAGWSGPFIKRFFDAGTANAFVLPGGKVFVFSGIFNMLRNDNGLATVLGHEIAHNLADHIAERMSSAIGENILLGSALLLSLSVGAGFIGIWLFGDLALDLFFGLPMGRLQESEADYIGLMMMAEACYDPREAVGFWQRMEQYQGNRNMEPPEWMSTHPSVRKAGHAARPPPGNAPERPQTLRR
jgi:metalloendopeptidase OMA1, mitochondrial